MTADVRIVDLHGYTLRPEDGLSRDHVRPASRQSDHYLDRYDRRTLFYDSVWLPERAVHLITAPRFLNLWRPFRTGLRTRSHAIHPRRRRTWLRCEQVEVPAPPDGFSLDLGAGSREIVSRTPLGAHFSGLDCLVAVSKDNALEWIADWAAYHARTHGSRGALIFDNASTQYDAAALAATLAAVPGLERAAVIRAPYPYGPSDQSGRLEVSPRFFQTAMLNLARRDAFAAARSVLSIDIDELVRSTSGQSIHDLAVRRPAGMVTVPGTWVYPQPKTRRPKRQRAHVYRAVPDRPCNPKWCIRPGGLMDRFGWSVHQIGGILQPLLTRQADATLLHCRATSTGWKASRFRLPRTLVSDPELAAFMRWAFPKPATRSPSRASQAPETSRAATTKIG